MALLHTRRDQTFIVGEVKRVKKKTGKKKVTYNGRMATVANVNHDGHPAVNGEMLGNAIE